MDNLPQGNVVKPQAVKKSNSKLNKEELYAQVCYYYPQYTFEEAEQLSYRRIRLLLRVAQKQQALTMYNLTQIVAAPHTEKGQGVSKLSEHFKKIANS